MARYFANELDFRVSGIDSAKWLAHRWLIPAAPRK